MKCHQATSEIFVPDGVAPAAALARTTHLGVGAHQDDLEILAVHGILECFRRSDRWFTGVVVTDGAGSARDLEYAAYSDEQMRAVRRQEQKAAALIGEYGAQVLLDHPSRAVKDHVEGVVEDLGRLVAACAPEVVYTHNLADKHDTHVAVTLRLLEALRGLEPAARPRRLIGCEVWRDLDWLPDDRKVAMPVDGHENLQAALLGVFDSQIAGGKRYDLGTLGRRRAHATFSESHRVDRHTGLAWGMDLTPLMDDDSRDPIGLAEELLAEFQRDVVERLRRLAFERKGS